MASSTIDSMVSNVIRTPVQLDSGSPVKRPTLSKSSEYSMGAHCSIISIISLTNIFFCIKYKYNIYLNRHESS